MKSSLQLFIIKGSDADDLLEGTANDDVFASTAGDDTLRGSNGDDTYHVDTNQGHDRVFETSGDNDRLVFANGVTLADLLATVTDTDGDGHDDLTISFANGSGSVTLEHVFRPEYWVDQRQVEWFEFSDGTILNKEDFFTIIGADGNSAHTVHVSPGHSMSIVGTASQDVFLSNDVDLELDGGDNGDFYLLNSGSARVNDSGDAGEDVVQFGAGFKLSHAHAIRTDLDGNGVDDLRVTFAGSTAMFTVLNAFAGTVVGSGNTIEKIRFSKSQSMTIAEFMDATANFVSGDELDNSLSGTAEQNTLLGREGNDTLNGGDGSDLYIFEAGDGHDVIEDNGNGDTDVLLIYGYDASDAKVEWDSDLDANSLRLVLGDSGDQITLVNTLKADVSDQIEEVRFEDGVVWSTDVLRQKLLDARMTAADDSVEGWSGNDSFLASEGNDTLNGQRGDDTYHIELGRGDDVILENEGEDVLVFGAGISLSDLKVTTADHIGGSFIDLKIEFVSRSGSVTLDGTHYANWSVAGPKVIETIRFADGTNYSWLEFLDATVNSGSSSNEEIYGTYQGNVFAASAGDDTLKGQGGDDVYHAVLNSGDDIILENEGDDSLVFGAGIALSDLKVTTANYVSGGSIDLKVEFTNGAGSITLDATHDANWSVADQKVVESIRFVDGASYSWLDFLDKTANAGSNADEEIYGTYDDNTFAASAGNDTLKGQGGDDTYHVELGMGHDVILENEGDDTLVFGDGITLSSLLVTTSDYVGGYLTDLRIAFSNGEGSITLDGTHSSSWFVAGTRILENFRFADGSSYTWKEFLEKNRERRHSRRRPNLRHFRGRRICCEPWK